MTQLRHSIGILTALLGLSAGAMVLETRAADQSAQPVAPQAAPSAQAAPASPAPPAAKPPLRSVPQVPEESATIRDDPTVAPDPKQSADKNVSFPNDI